MMPRLALLASAMLLAACATSQPYQAAELKGQVSYRERIAFPADKTRVDVRLLNVNGPAPVVLAETLIEKPAGVPIPFVLRYDANTKGSLQLDAKLWVDGQLMMATPEPQVLALPLSAPLDVIVTTVRGN